TQESASTTLDLPDPLGPTTQVMPGSRRSVVAEANDLKPRSVRDFRYTRPLLPRNRRSMRSPRTSRHPNITASSGRPPETAREREIPPTTGDQSMTARVKRARQGTTDQSPECA